MTRKQFDNDATIQKALKRAREQGIEVYGHGIDSEGRRFWRVTSSEQARRGGAGRGYTVLLVGSRLMCDCLAGERGDVCKHRVLVCQTIMQEAEDIKATQHAAYEEAATRNQRTSYEQDIDKAAARIRRKEQLRKAKKARA